MSKPIFSDHKSRKSSIVIFLILIVLAVTITYYILNKKSDENTKNTVTTKTKVLKTTTPKNSNTAAPTLETEVLIEDLENVWDIGFLPDETLLFTERPGRLSALVDGEAKLIEEIPNVFAEGEGGLLGLAVDKKFEDNSYIYICYNAKIDNKIDVRVTRILLNSDLSINDEEDIITGISANESGRHSGCRIRMDKEENLWITTGDAALEKNPQDKKSLAGKVLRVDRDGKAIEGNLGDDFDSRIFSYGHRNLQGIALFDEAIDGVYGVTTEHGTDVDDEINLLTKGNFGWNPGSDYDESVAMTDLDKYPDALPAIWSSGDPTIAFSGATFLSGNQWGAYEGRVAVAVLKDQELRIFEFDEKYNLLSEESFLKDFGRLRSAVQGPDGNLYLTTDNSGNDKIIKVTPVIK